MQRPREQTGTGMFGSRQAAGGCGDVSGEGGGARLSVASGEDPQAAASVLAPLFPQGCRELPAP